ncbi:TRAP transporter small permease [Paracoccus sp. MKU1]|uniref:TRAP transporter small permease n=1 Tax=Paracoccus sp. MKU1 TaxID=1745182 RepID=UPI0007192A58|nr:TRAP transporter small permease subunit [Paracoccus sp. MKU1]KRW94497.1 hypothetical protein AQY21_19450 [Paracoccus sp. MKU1]
MAGFEQMVRLVTRGLALVGFAGLLLLAIMQTANIAARFLFSYPLQGVNDVSAVVMAVVVACCIPECLATRLNIRIDVLGQMFGTRAEAVLNAFASLVTLGVFALIFWNFIPYAAASTASGERTWVLGWPVGPWWWAATAAFLASVLAQAMVVVADLRAVAR